MGIFTKYQSFMRVKYLTVTKDSQYASIMSAQLAGGADCASALLTEQLRREA